jgi:ribonuclease R
MKKTKKLKHTSRKSSFEEKQTSQKKRHTSPKRTFKNKPTSPFKQIEGTLFVSAGGSGKVVVDGKTEYLVERGFLGTGLFGDTVIASTNSSARDKVKSARVKKILSRNKLEYVGTIIDEEADFFFLKPQDTRVYVHVRIPKQHASGAKIGEKVLIKITHWNDPKELPLGEVIEVIGKANVHETEMLAVLLDKGIKSKFEKVVEKEAEMLKSQEKEIIAEELKTRRDIRNILTFTIDPDDAKDFDDALSFQTLENGDIEIGVHIADVSHYVTPGSELDNEALRRGTSVYMVDRTVPMLPEILSNDLCSLNPQEDKLAFSVFFTFSPESITTYKRFTLKKYTVEKTVIRSHTRFTYETAQQVLDTRNGDHVQELIALNILAKKLAKQNKKDGALSFAQEEVKFVLDEQKRPIDVKIKHIGETNELIEQFMLLANKVVTEYIQKKVPEKERLFLYRIHDKPDKDRVLELIQLLHGLGYKLTLKKDGISTEELNQILHATEDTPESNMVQVATIRSMAKAIYSIQNIGHFGLAFANYTHFTSPIRRYPDIIVHRLIKAYEEGKRIPQSQWKKYASLAQDLSDKEKNAMGAERNSIKYKQVEYMQDKTDQTFDGTITGITEWGLYVEESKTKAEGLVRIRDLNDDYYIYHKEKMALTGSKKKKSYRLGDPVKIKIKKLDINNKTIDFEII